MSDGFLIAEKGLLDKLYEANDTIAADRDEWKAVAEWLAESRGHPVFVEVAPMEGMKIRSTVTARLAAAPKAVAGG